MPARFVEVKIPVTSGADALGYVQSFHLNYSLWRGGDWVRTGNWGNSSNWSNSRKVGRLASRAALTLANARAPVGPAKWLLCAALALLLARTMLLRRATRHAVSQFGHAE